MPRSAGIAVENNFRNGLITEASGINFPESACVETENCIFKFDGSVVRRKGINFEPNYDVQHLIKTNSVINTYVWRNVSGDGNTTLAVVQLGSILFFYNTSSDSVSSGALSSYIDMAGFNVSGAPAPNTLPAQFSSGNGLLFVTHPFCDPFKVSYDPGTNTVSGEIIVLRIRDLEGDPADPYDIAERPIVDLINLDNAHRYNLYNQGWNSTNLTAWDARGDMPSNADVMWSFKNTSDVFDVSTIDGNMRGNSPAPKGHYILNLHYQDRDALGGSGIETTGVQRPSTSAFFAGRVFYSGINFKKYNSRIYFSQIVEREAQYGYVHQANDPTSEEAFDLLPTDGGMIDIQEAGSIYKLFTIANGLVAFAANGVWMITGSTGIGFTATDYSVSKLSSIPTLTASSFVDIGGMPSWWNSEGIYTIKMDGGSPQVVSLSRERIQSFYDSIPLASKSYVKGGYNYIDGVVQWVYRSDTAATPDENYDFDRILNYNTKTGAFYVWTIPPSNVKLNGILILDTTQGTLAEIQVQDDDGDDVVDDDGNEVVTYESVGLVDAPFFKYLVSFPYSGSHHDFTFANEYDEAYVDWASYDDIGVEYESFLASGYRLRGEGIRKYQDNWVTVFSKTTEPVAYDFQGMWDYALNGSGTGRWSVKQGIVHDDTNYSHRARRLKVRGHGKVLQFRLSSRPGKPFHCIGWSTFSTANSIP